MPEGNKDIKATDSIKETSNYRSIFKATSLFGGVQIYQILIGIIKAKFVAVILGPAGMGIMGLYQSTIDLIKSVSSCGLESSAVRDVSEANKTDDSDRISLIAATLKRLTWITGISGIVITLVLSPLLSKVSFGNIDYTWGFVFLSITLLINQMCSAQKVLLQGMRRLKDLAKASAYGATVGLMVSVPIYYWIGTKGIVPTMILTSVTALILSWYYSRKIIITKHNITTRQAITEGRVMLRLGIAMSFTGIITLTYAYVLRSYIRHLGGIEEVGLFTAGFSIINTYVGMIFTAMGTDFYPRLAEVNQDNKACRTMVNQQIEIASLIMGPLVLMCLLFMPFVLKLIYSDHFLDANNYIFWAVSGMHFKLASWAIAYQFVAKGDSKLFVFNELLGGTLLFICNIVGYKLMGLTGVGVGFTVAYFLYLCQVLIITRRYYEFCFSIGSLKLWAVQILLSVVCVCIVFIFNNIVQYIFGGILVLLSILYSFKGLEQRMQIVSFIRKNYGK